MTKKVLVATSLTAIFVVSMLFAGSLTPAFAPPPPYGTVTGGSVTSNPAGNVYTFTVTTSGKIPHVPDTYITTTAGLVAYGWLDGSGNAVVVAIHPGAVDSTQNPNNWHPHTATLDGSGCVTSLSDPQGGVAIKGSTLSLQMRASVATVSPSTFSGPPAAFTLVGGCVASLP